MKHKNIFKHIKATLLIALQTFINVVLENCSMFIYVMIVAVAGITASNLEGRPLSLFLTFLVVTTTLLAINYIISVSKRVNEDGKPQIPVLPYRLTRKENGKIILDNEEACYKAIRYLADVEDYIERNGLRNNNENF